MNDDQAQRLLTGIDGPRPLPTHRRDELLATLTTAHELATADAPRALPADLRHRLEATLVSASARPLPFGLRRRVLSATTRSTPRVLAVAAAAVLVLVAGIALTVRPDNDATQEATRRSGPTQPPGSIATGSGGASGRISAGSSSGDVAGGAGITAGETSGGTSADSGSAAGSAAPVRGTRSSGQTGDIVIGVAGNGTTDIVTGFHAYLATVNATGGINGRRLVTAEGDDVVATVNLSSIPRSDSPKGVLFETVFHPLGVMRGRVVSLSSPLERQARLAVARAYPRSDPNARVAIYADTTDMWRGAVSDAFQHELEARGVRVVKVLFNPSAPAYVPGVEAAFLALPPEGVSAWVTGAPSAPTKGVWAIGSAFDDRLADAGERLALLVLSPYRPITGDEATALRNALPDRALTTGAVHGWVTAKAIVELLRRNGGTAITETDLDKLTGWDPAWSPPFETRAGTRERTPEAILLRPVDGRFVSEGAFQRSGH